MVSTTKARLFFLSLPDIMETPHFKVQSFRVNKKIVGTLNLEECRVCIKLSEIDQSVFCSFDTSVIFPVPNKWGKQGWTLINLKQVKMALFKDAVLTSYKLVVPKKIVINQSKY